VAVLSQGALTVLVLVHSVLLIRGRAQLVHCVGRPALRGGGVFAASYDMINKKC